MIIRYYKGNIFFDKLKEMTKTTRDGTTAYHMVETLKFLGFHSEGIKEENMEDIRTKNLPCIAHMKYVKNNYHYVVIYHINFKKRQVIIADPADKIKTVSLDEFKKNYNEILILMHPIRKIPVYYNYRALVQFAIQKLHYYKGTIIKIFVLSILVSIFSIFVSFNFKFTLEAINIHSKPLLSQVFIIFLVIYILKIMADYMRNHLLLYLNNHLDYSLTMEVFSNILLSPYPYFKNRTTGEVISRIQDLSKVREMLSRVALSLSIDLFLTLISSIVLIFLSKKLFIISFVILILYVIIILLFQPKFHKDIKSIQQENSIIHSFMIECLNGIENLKGLNLISGFLNHFSKKYQAFTNQLNRFQKRYNLESLLKEIINSLGPLFLLYIGANLVIKKTITLGELLSFYALFYYFLNPIKNILNLNILIFESKNAFLRIDELLIKDEKIPLKKIDKIKTIEFSKLSFSLDDEYFLLNKINTTICENNHVVIIGKSGSGKSTLLKILKGYYKVLNNQIYINGEEYNDYQNIGEKIAYVSQNEILYTNTLYENLDLFREKTENEILKICQVCCLDEIIKENNLNFLIEENGFNLSGGERQRIILARALLNNFDVLIIDEGLSQVDIYLERKILKNIKELFLNKIIIFVTHRYDNIDLFDQLIYLENGSILKEKIRNKN